VNKVIKEELELYKAREESLAKDIAKVEADLKVLLNQYITGEGINSEEDAELVEFQMRKCTYAIQGMSAELLELSKKRLALLRW